MCVLTAESRIAVKGSTVLSVHKIVVHCSNEAEISRVFVLYAIGLCCCVPKE